MPAGAYREIEIKLAIDNDDAIRAALRKLGFRISKPRVLETNTVFDTPDHSLRQSQRVLRVRRAGDRSVLTYKSPPARGRHKSREEIEVAFPDPSSLEAILERLGYQPSFRYEKFRTEYRVPGSTAGVAMVDETPIGTFLELEGSPTWIDRMARALGFAPKDYITDGYGARYLEHCRRLGIEPSHLVFSPALSSAGTRKTRGAQTKARG